MSSIPTPLKRYIRRYLVNEVEIEDIEEEDASSGSLATSMQDEGSIEQNADILNLYLDGATLLIGAPEPIESARTTEPVSTVIFNNNFSRERYGKSAVDDLISVEEDRIDLLLDDNQSDSEKALSIISSLEFDNGLNAVQEMSDSDVADLDQPDLDKFEEYPESMFSNATELSEEKESLVFNAVAASSDAVEAIAGYE